MQFIKHHWFGFLMSVLFGAYLIVFLWGIISPSTFEVCTMKMAENFVECGGQIWCSIKAVLKNMSCEVEVIFN